MPFFTLAGLIRRAGDRISRYSKAKAQFHLDRDVSQYSDEDHFDIFFSHRSIDYSALLVLKDAIEDYGFTIYVDDVQDPFLKREDVNKNTAKLLRKRIDQSDCLLFATTDTSPESKWMPWELGYADGRSGRVAILPVLTTAPPVQHTYKGQEYLGLYPYLTLSDDTEGLTRLWVNETITKCIVHVKWISGEEPHEHPRR